MAQAQKKVKITLLKSCVVLGTNVEAFDEVTVDKVDGAYLVGAGSAIDASTDAGKKALATAKAGAKSAAADKKAVTKK